MMMPANACTSTANQVAVQDYFGLVRSIAANIKRRLPVHVEVEDLVQSGMIGLLEAQNRYDASRAVEFSSYANSRITGAILDELRRLDTCSRRERRTARAIEDARQRLRAMTGQEPEAVALAHAVGMRMDEYHHTLQRLESSKQVSVQAAEASISSDEMDNLPSSEESPFQIYSRRESWMKMKERIEELKPRQRDVLYLYYFEELGLKKIGERLGVSEARTSQIHQEAIRMLRRKAHNEKCGPHPRAHTQSRVQ
ncbi:MAG TPA: FliA/WhiG family RNA polymerase sigma factor [Candidatus Saccharimonadales bacterium]|jgi:RNA polymerase sigma factor for flagellar operon FliA|nr:FliA/WhiG family RNA polymerase sigma factor [Candidatus Saccharimonadales bacterium]